MDRQRAVSTVMQGDEKDRRSVGAVPGNLTVDEHVWPENGSKGKWNSVETMQYIFIGQRAK